MTSRPDHETLVRLLGVWWDFTTTAHEIARMSTMAHLALRDMGDQWRRAVLAVANGPDRVVEPVLENAWRLLRDHIADPDRGTTRDLWAATTADTILAALAEVDG